jgi:hypothetical protein
MYSQAGQDAWVMQLHPQPGSYLEIGASHPTLINNTYLLEQNGWQGVSFDIDSQNQQLWTQQRKNPLIITDALKFDWAAFCDLPFVTDYLQIDIDPPAQSFEVLQRIIETGAEFKLITFEHDAYTDGGAIRAASRDYLTKHGYTLHTADVSTQGMVFEDWWVNKKYIKL